MKRTVTSVLIPIDLKTITPKDSLGLLFKNENGVINMPNDIDDVMKGHGYFGNIPHHLYILTNDGFYNQDWVYSPDGKSKGQPEVFIYNSKIDYSTYYGSDVVFQKIIATTDPVLEGVLRIPDSFLRQYVNTQGQGKIQARCIIVYPAKFNDDDCLDVEMRD